MKSRLGVLTHIEAVLLISPTTRKEYDMDYAGWKLRRQILADGTLTPEVKVNGLILVEVINWNTGTKTFTTKKHLDNWLKSTAETWDIRPEVDERTGEVIFDSAHVLKIYGINGLDRAGYLT